MTKRAWVINGIVHDVCEGNPQECYVKDVADFYTTDVPDGTRHGATLIDGEWTNDATVKSAQQIPQSEGDFIRVSPVEFKLLFTSAERIAIKESKDPVIVDFFEIINDPRLTFINLGLESTKSALNYLQQQSLITEDRKALILQGQVN